MIARSNGGYQREFRLGEAIAGLRCDSLELTREDFRRITDIAKSPEATAAFMEWLVMLQCRFGPE